jgi:hypothetical protein
MTAITMPVISGNVNFIDLMIPPSTPIDITGYILETAEILLTNPLGPPKIGGFSS